MKPEKKELDVLHSTRNNDRLVRFVRHSRRAKMVDIIYECIQYIRCHIAASRIVANVLSDRITSATDSHKSGQN